MHPFFPCALAVLTVVPALGHAACYEIISSSNQTVYRSRVAPIDLSKPISEGMAGRFPGSTMVFSPDESDCREVALAGSAMVSAQGSALQDGSGYAGRSSLASGTGDLSTSMPPTAAGSRAPSSVKRLPSVRTDR